VKRALKISLLVFGGIAAAGGLAFWDTFARATRAIAAHEARLASDMAALRTRPALAPLPEDVRPLRYENAHSLQEPLARLHVMRDDLARRMPSTPDTSAELLERLARSQESLREGGYLAYELRRRDEERELRGWKQILQDEHPPSDELRHVARRLDQLLAARPSARDVILGESVLDRQEVLQWLRGGDGSYWMLVEGPGWRELYSKTLLAAKALHQLRDLEVLVLGIEGLPVLEREARAIEEGQKNLRTSRLTRSDLAAREGALFQGERILRTEWALARTATAIARFRAERKRHPGLLKELVPDYLEEVPVNAYTGASFAWDPDQGVLETRPGGLGPQSRWELGRP
jgi:hypothetical protein